MRRAGRALYLALWASSVGCMFFQSTDDLRGEAAPGNASSSGQPSSSGGDGSMVMPADASDDGALVDASTTPDAEGGASPRACPADALFCADFDDAEPYAGLLLAPAEEGCSVTGAEAASPPSSLLCRSESGGATVHDHTAEHIRALGGATTVRVDFDVFGQLPAELPSGETVFFFTLFLTRGTEPSDRATGLTLRYQDTRTLLSYDDIGFDGGVPITYRSIDMPRNRWAHVTLSIALGASPQLTWIVDGTESAPAELHYVGGAPTEVKVQMGLTRYAALSSSADLYFDNLAIAYP